MSVPAITAPPTLAEMARERIESAILAGDLMPGERLVEEALCESLSISRQPLREALKELVHTGLVEHLPRRGMRVREITQHDVYEIATMRSELEVLAVKYAPKELDPVRLASCDAALDRMKAIAQENDESKMVRAGFDFHCSLVALSGHSRITDTYRSMALQLQLCMAMNNQARRSVENLWQNYERHKILLDVVKTRDDDKILKALEEHGHLTYVQSFGQEFEGQTPQSKQWIDQVSS